MQPDADEIVGTLIDAALTIRFAYKTHEERYQELTMRRAWDDYAQSADSLMKAIEAAPDGRYGPVVSRKGVGAAVAAVTSRQAQLC